MTRTLTLTACALALCATISPSAVAAPNLTIMHLDVMAEGDSAVAVVTLGHAMGARLEVDLVYTVNGNDVKNEPIVVDRTTYFVERLGPKELPYTVCASIDGLIRIVGDLSVPTAGELCEPWIPAPSTSSATRDLLAGRPDPGRSEPAAPPEATPVRRATATPLTGRR